jgi:hypothetical protein
LLSASSFAGGAGAAISISDGVSGSGDDDGGLRVCCTGRVMGRGVGQLTSSSGSSSGSSSSSCTGSAVSSAGSTIDWGFLSCSGEDMYSEDESSVDTSSTAGSSG